MKKKKTLEPKICKEVVTGELFLVYKYEDLGNGNFFAKSKRKLTEKEILELNLEKK